VVCAQLPPRKRHQSEPCNSNTAQFVENIAPDINGDVEVTDSDRNPSTVESSDGTEEPVEVDVEDSAAENSDNEQHETHSNAPDPVFLLVEVSMLMQLLHFCRICGHKPKKAQPKMYYKKRGTACKATLWCQRCNKHSIWHSQSKIGNTHRYRGNVEIPAIASAVPINYSSISEFARLLGMPFVSNVTFYKASQVLWKQVDNAYSIMRDTVIGIMMKMVKDYKFTIEKLQAF
jgi:hypothetical protein